MSIEKDQINKSIFGKKDFNKYKDPERDIDVIKLKLIEKLKEQERRKSYGGHGGVTNPTSQPLIFNNPLNIIISGSDNNFVDLLFWMPNDAHVKRDKDNGRNSITIAASHIQTAEPRIDFTWTLSDLSAITDGDHTPEASEITEILSQLSNLNNYVYLAGGNHDTQNADDPENGLEWFNDLVEQLNNQQISRPFQLLDGSTNDCYAFTVGNALFITAIDYNNGPETEGGRGNSPTAESGYPTGGLSNAQWVKIVNWIFLHLDKIIFVNTHHALVKDTTLVSGYNDNSYLRLHGPDPDYPGGEGMVHFIGTDRGSDNQGTRIPFDLFSKSTQLVDLFIHGHSHPRLTDSLGGKTIIKRNFFGGSNILNNACLTKYWAVSGVDPDPNSWFGKLSGSLLNLKRMIHYTPNAASASLGEYYSSSEMDLTMKKVFQRSYTEPTPSTPTNLPISLSFNRVMNNKVTLAWTSSNADGHLILRKSGSLPSSSPSDNSTYILGETLGDGTVISVGTKTEIVDYEVISGSTYYYKIIPFNAGGGSIKYGTNTLTGSQFISQGNVYCDESFSFNIYNPYNVVRGPMTDRGSGSYHIFEDSKCKFIGTSINSATVQNMDNVIYSRTGITSSGDLYMSAYLKIENPNSGASNNMFTCIGIMNSGSTIERGDRNVIRIVYGAGPNENDRGEHGIRLQIHSGGVLRYNQSASYSEGWWKIHYNTSSSLTQFYKWDTTGSSWTQQGTNQNFSITASAMDFRIYAGAETRVTASTGGTSSYTTNWILSTVDFSGLSL